MNGGQKKIVLGVPRVKEAGKILRKVKTLLSQNDFRTWNRQRKARKVPVLNQDTSASETFREGGFDCSWESDDWYSS